MRTNEFFYWLQGYFEIRGIVAAADLTAEQFTCIVRHLGLVDVGEGGSPGAARIGKIRAIVEFALDGSMPIEAATKKIKAEVHDQFVHVIDPAAGGPEAQAHLNAVHGNIPNKPGMRC